MDRTFYKKLFYLVLPIAFQQFMLSLVGASDAIMLGMISQNALSAVSLAGQVMFVFNLFMVAFTAGHGDCGSGTCNRARQDGGVCMGRDGFRQGGQDTAETWPSDTRRSQVGRNLLEIFAARFGK